MRRLTFLLLCLFIGIGVATAQTMKITGKCYIIGRSATRDRCGCRCERHYDWYGLRTFEGNFSLDVPRDAKMIFISYVGLKTKEVPVASVINVVFGLGFKSVG